MTDRQKALQLIEQLGAELTDESEPGELKGEVVTPAGLVWKATDCHTIALNFHTNRPAGWTWLLTEMEQGTSPCDDEDCEMCEA